MMITVLSTSTAPLVFTQSPFDMALGHPMIAPNFDRKKSLTVCSLNVNVLFSELLDHKTHLESLKEGKIMSEFSYPGENTVELPR